MTSLCVSIMVDTVEQAHADAALAAERGADLVEYRVDTFFESGGDVNAVTDGSPLPCIVTCRPSWEGGHFEGDDRLRIDLFSTLSAASTVDVEAKAIVALPGLRDGLAPSPEARRVIYSSHDFDGRPADLTRRVMYMADDDRCTISKIAWHARSLRDNLEAFELLAERSKPMIALCMGEAGLPSRVLAKKFGGFLTFVGLNDESVTAPGQVGVATMKSLYRWDAINADTAVYGVIGHPVGHSMSPAIMNGGFDAANHNGVYLPMPIPPEYEHFKATVGSWLDYKPLDFRGASVTIPHKANLMRFVAERGGEVEPLAQKIGAANTLVVHDDGSLFACNTDYAALLDSVCAARSIERDGLDGLRVAILGAGGAARAAVAGFTAHGCDVTVYNRTLEKARNLANTFGATAAALESFMGDCDVLINCTPVGMHPNIDASPIEIQKKVSDTFFENTVVFDTIYNPIETKLLRDAQSHGASTISGVEMFVRQAARQFELWTGQDAPTELFDRIVREKLSG